ncbi:MAG: hypothetical protein ACE5K8_01100 [Candidatus Zixiibacteriota bacterium]
MKSTLKAAACIVVMLTVPAFVSAQVDHFGKLDTVYAEVAKIDDYNWTRTVSCTNDEPLAGLAVPLKMTAGLTRIVADSAVYTGGRVEKFAYKAFRADTAIQCVLLGMVANLGPTDNVLAPGKGRLATVFVSSLDKKPIEKLVVDTTTLQPNNSLMFVADRIELNKRGDSIPPELSENLQIFPAFVTIESGTPADVKAKVSETTRKE